jgi:hypothetical protein
VSIRSRGLFFGVEASLGCSYWWYIQLWFLGQVKLVVISIFLFQMVVGYFCFQKSRFGLFQNGSWHCANRVVMFCGFSAIKVETSKQRPPKCKIKGVHNKSFKPTALRAAA